MIFLNNFLKVKLTICLNLKLLYLFFSTLFIKFIIEIIMKKNLN